jgi:nitronate monooxygenase
MWHETGAACRLGIDYPIIQGPFGGNLSSVDLAATVSNAGGLGSFGAHQLSPDQIQTLAQTLRSRTARPFAINLWIDNADAGAADFTQLEFERHVERFRPYFAELGLPMPEMPRAFGYDTAEQIEAVLEARPPVFSFVFGIPTPEVLRACRACQIITVGTATSVPEARALEEAGVDCIVATGSEAGSHRPSFLAAPESSLIGTFVLVQLVRAAVRVPVIAAGGIASGRSIAAALALGADGVQIGTAFLACDQSSASAAHREAILSGESTTTVLTRLLSGRLSRSIANRLTKELAVFENDPAPYPIQGWIVGQLRAAAIAQNRPELMSLGAGQIAPLVSYCDANALFAALVRETGEVFDTNGRR